MMTVPPAKTVAVIGMIIDAVQFPSMSKLIGYTALGETNGVPPTTTTLFPFPVIWCDPNAPPPPAVVEGVNPVPSRVTDSLGSAVFGETLKVVIRDGDAAAENVTIPNNAMKTAKTVRNTSLGHGATASPPETY